MKLKCRRSLKNVASALVVVAIASSGSSVKAADQVPNPNRSVPQTIEPPQSSTQDLPAIPNMSRAPAPEGAETISIRIADVIVEGGTSDLEAETAALTSPFNHRVVNIADIYALAAAVEHLYAARGFILTRATVPPQRLASGATVRIVVVDGFIEDIDVSQIPAGIRRAVARKLSPLRDRRAVSLSDIERRVLLASRTPGVELETTLAPGTQSGGVRLIVKAAWHPLSGSLTAGNPLSTAFDRWSLDAQVAGNSLLGEGEQIYGFASTATDFAVFGAHPMRRVIGVGANLPLGSDGWNMNFEYIGARTNPTPPLGGLVIDGRVERAAFRLRYPLVLSRRESLNVNGAFEIANERQSAPAFNARLSEDRLRSFSLGVDGATIIGGDVRLGASALFVQGISGLNARTVAEAVHSGVPLSRQGARPGFSAMNVNAAIATTLGGPLDLSLALRTQLSLDNALPSSAQFSLDASDGLSGFDSGALSSDSGVTARAELGTRLPLRAASAAPYLFAAGGHGRLYAPTALERDTISGWSVGMGMRLDASRSVRLRSELAHFGSANAASSTRLRASISYNF